MANTTFIENQVQQVSSFEDFISVPFHRVINSVCWSRQLEGDFSEIVEAIDINENITEVNHEELCQLELSEQGQLAQSIILTDLKRLKAQGAAPTLNLIKSYERDDAYPFFPTDVYSFHVDRSPIPTDTILCTYYGESSEILPNAQGIQKTLVPGIRKELKKLYDGPSEGFDSFLSEYFFDLHYQAKPQAKLISLGLGNLWRLAVDHPESKVPPCLHRAPKENNGQTRLLLIC